MIERNDPGVVDRELGRPLQQGLAASVVDRHQGLFEQQIVVQEMRGDVVVRFGVTP